jgi:hypothetical protein
MQQEFGFKPSSLQSSWGNIKNRSSLVLRQAFVIEEINNLTQFLWQDFDRAMKLHPHAEVIWFVRFAGKGSARIIRRLVIRVVMVGCSFQAEMMLLEIEQFPANLGSGKVEEVPHRFELNLGQSPVQTNEAVLENVICLLPPS